MPSQEVAGDVGSRIRTSGKRPDPVAGVSVPDLVRYRAAAADLLVEVAAYPSADDLPRLETVLTDPMAGPDFGAALGGVAEAAHRLRLESRDYRPNNRGGGRVRWPHCCGSGRAGVT